MNQINDTIHAVGGAWGGDGLQGRKVTTAAEIMSLAGLGFHVEGRPVFNAQGQAIKGYKAVTRTDTGQVFQVASDSYGILQPSDAVNLLDSAAGLGACSYTSAGAIDGGARMFVTCALPDEIRIGRDDVIKPYLSVINSFDGSTAAIVKALSFRQICRNTFLRSLRTEQDTEFRVKHSTNVKARLALAMEAIKAAGYTFSKLGETYRALARMRFSETDMRNLADALVPTKPHEKTGEIPAQARTARETLVILFEQGKGQAEFSDIRGTGWAALNAVTEYVDHLRPTRLRNVTSEDEARLNSAWFGSGAAMKNTAWDYLTQRLEAH